MFHDRNDPKYGSLTDSFNRPQMLYDPQWEVKTKRPSLAGFIAWLETKNPDENYDYGDTERCALGQYYRSLGREPETYPREVFPTYWDQSRLLNFGKPTEQVFGRALKNIRDFMGQPIMNDELTEYRMNFDTIVLISGMGG